MTGVWQGVFPAATTQFRPDLALDLPATLNHLDRMIDAGLDRACQVIYGKRHAWALAWATALSLLVDARAPWRSADERAVSATAARRWLAIARSR